MGSRWCGRHQGCVLLGFTAAPKAKASPVDTGLALLRLTDALGVVISVVGSDVGVVVLLVLEFSRKS